MGLFDSIKKSLGMPTVEIELKLQPETMYVGGELQGKITVRAVNKTCNVQSLMMQLIHTFVDTNDYGYSEHHEEIPAHIDILSMASIEPQAPFEDEFFFGLPPHVAPSLGHFGWRVRATAILQGGAEVVKEQHVPVRLSPVMFAIYDLVHRQFGFKFHEIGADNDGIWLTFEPTPAVRAHFNGLELSFDEQEDVIYLWVQLQARRGVIEEELTLHKSRFLMGHTANADALMQVLQPIFRI